MTHIQNRNGHFFSVNRFYSQNRMLNEINSRSPVEDVVRTQMESIFLKFQFHGRLST